MREAYEAKVAGKPCRICPNRRVEAHHIVHRGRIGSKHPQINHPDNIIPLCYRCHQDHHTTAHRRVPWDVLTEAEQEFLVEYGGIGWAERWYPATGLPTGPFS